MLICQDDQFCGSSWLSSQYFLLTACLPKGHITTYDDEDPPPWDIHETIDIFMKEGSERRQVAGSEWLLSLEELESTIGDMEVEKSNAILRRTDNPSPLLTLQQL